MVCWELIIKKYLSLYHTQTVIFESKFAGVILNFSGLVKSRLPPFKYSTQ